MWAFRKNNNKKHWIEFLALGLASDSQGIYRYSWGRQWGKPWISLRSWKAHHSGLSAGWYWAQYWLFNRNMVLVMGWYVFSDSMFTLSSFQFPKAELLWGCTECPQNMVHLYPLGNDSTTLSKVNFGVHSSSLDGLPSTQLVCRCLPGIFIHHYPGINFACLWWCFLFPVSHNFHFLGLLPLFGGV